MAEQVSVRLAVVGGTQFRNELTAAGQSGSAAMDRISTSSKRLGPQVQNASYQIGDFAVQVASGQSATRAFAQQMPQLLGGFGVLGAVAGAAVAVMAALAPLFLKASDNSTDLIKNMDDIGGVMGGVHSATSALEAIQREYNQAVSDSGSASSTAARLVVANSAAEFEARKRVLSSEIEIAKYRGIEVASDLKNLKDTFELEAKAVLDGGARQYQGETSSNNPSGRSRLRGDPQQAREFDKFLAENGKKIAQIRALEGEYDVLQMQQQESEKLLDTKFEDITTGGTGNTSPGKSGTGSGSKATKEQNAALKEQQKLFDETRTKAERYAIEIENIEALYKSGAISTEVYERKMALLKGQFESQTSFAKEISSTLKSSMDSLFDSIFEGGNKASEAVANLAQKLASMMLQKGAYTLLSSFAPTIFGKDGLVPLVASANGNVFSGGDLVPFANGGVVNRATTFPMRGGVGLMGEAGPEAILPLTRIGGKLGVAAVGGGSSGGGDVVISMTVNAQGAQQGVADEVSAQLRQAFPALAKSVRAEIAARQSKGYSV